MVVSALRDQEMSTDRLNELAGTLFAREINMTNVELMDAFADYVLRRPNPKELHMMIIYRIFLTSSKNGQKLSEDFFRSGISLHPERHGLYQLYINFAHSLSPL